MQRFPPIVELGAAAPGFHTRRFQSKPFMQKKNTCNISVHRIHATCTSMSLRPDYPGFNVDWLFVDSNIFDVRQTFA
jgi:hypothetical protein